MTPLFPIDDPHLCYCDVLGYEPGQFNLTLRAYREADFRQETSYRYYLLQFFFTVYFRGPLFWQGMAARRGTPAETAALAPFAAKRVAQMQAAGQFHYPRHYHLESDLGPVDIIAGVSRIYAQDSAEPLSFNGKDGRWFADWPIVFEEGFPGTD